MENSTNVPLLFKPADIAFLIERNDPFVWKFIDAHEKEYPPYKGSHGKHKKYDFATTRRIIHDLYTKNYTPKIKVQTFYNFKGGTGKTTICYQISTFLALLGFKVLVIDCDPQAHLTNVTGIDMVEKQFTLHDVVTKKCTLKEAINKEVLPGYDVLPSNVTMTRLEQVLNMQPAREYVLSKIIEPLKEEYDFIFLDANPALSYININAVLASDMTNIVCEPHAFSLMALVEITNEIKNYEELLQRQIPTSIIVNRHDERTNTSQACLAAIVGNEQYCDKTYTTAIVKKSEDFNISTTNKTPIFACVRKTSNAYIECLQLARAIISKSCEEKRPLKGRKKTTEPVQEVRDAA